MTGTIVERAWGKINLSLDVTGKLENGYHALCSVMQSVSLYDEAEVSVSRGAGRTEVTADWKFLPGGADNLAGKAAIVFRKAAELPDLDVKVALRKHIPVCAGMGGGSSDAAAVLRALDRLCKTGYAAEELCRLAGEVGSDVPFCVMGGTALAQGRGEILTPLAPMPDCGIVLCKPRFGVSTPELFQRLDARRVLCRPDTQGLLAALEKGALQEAAVRAFNVFEDVLGTEKQEVQSIKSVLYDAGALGAAMTGTGPTVFGLFRDPASAEAAAALLRPRYRDTFAVRPVPASRIPV